MNVDVKNDDNKNVNEVDKRYEPNKSKPKMFKQMDIEEKDPPDGSFDRTKLIKENLYLLSEIDKLKHSNSSLSQRVYYLESIVRAPLKK